jgi:hypothetical protein
MAAAVLLLLHVPPDIASLRVVVDPTHTLNVPPIAGGAGFTVMIRVAAQPVGNVYVIMAVPADTPTTSPVVTPVVTAVAMPVLLLLHVPAPVVSVKVIDCPWHTLPGPSTGDIAFTIIDRITVQPRPTV